jgi:hypothetical protein
MKGLGSLLLCACAARLDDMELNKSDSYPALVPFRGTIYQMLETTSSVSPR